MTLNFTWVIGYRSVASGVFICSFLPVTLPYFVCIIGGVALARLLIEGLFNTDYLVEQYVWTPHSFVVLCFYNCNQIFGRGVDI